VKTTSGATAVQVVCSSWRGSREIEHLGSAHDESELEALRAAAQQRIAAGQLELGLGLEPAGGPAGSASRPQGRQRRSGAAPGGPSETGTAMMSPAALVHQKFYSPVSAAFSSIGNATGPLMVIERGSLCRAAATGRQL
jgi:hypothetical protein